MRRPAAVEIRSAAAGKIEEIVLRDSQSVHIERMNSYGWFMAVVDRDGKRWQFWFGARPKNGKVEFLHTEGPYE